MLALTLSFVLGFFLGRLFAPKCPPCPVPASSGSGAGTGRGSGSPALGTGIPDKPGNGSGQGTSEAGGGNSMGNTEGAGKITPHDFAGEEVPGDGRSHRPDDGDPMLDRVSHGGARNKNSTVLSRNLPAA